MSKEFSGKLAADLPHRTKINFISTGNDWTAMMRQFLSVEDAER
ncbi:MAG: hypothetical protein R3C56_38985 [Pirellulaceae bacterium]